MKHLDPDIIFEEALNEFCNQRWYVKDNKNGYVTFSKEMLPIIQND